MRQKFRMKKLASIFALLFAASFSLFAQYSDLYNFGYNLGLEMFMTYTEVDDTISIPAGQYTVREFTLEYASKVTVQMSSNVDLGWYLVDTTDYALLKNGKEFSCYNRVSASGIDKIYGEILLPPGNYYYVINNNTKGAASAKRLITVYPQIL